MIGRRLTVATIGLAVLTLFGAACTADSPNEDGEEQTQPGEPGPGITDDTITIGLSYVEDAKEANEETGAGEATQIDAERAYDALIADVNERGGINGRELVPVYHRFRAQSSEPIEQQDQKACVKWTQDEPVFASDSGLGSDNLLQCLEDAGAVVQGGDSLHLNGQTFFDEYPHYIQAFGVDLNDLSDVYVQGLDELGFFDEGANVGVLTYDDPDYQDAVDAALLPALEAVGIEPTEVQYVKQAETGEDIGEVVSQVSNAVVKFKSSDVTHVMFLDYGANLAYFFSSAAEEQQYHPRYGLNTTSGNTTLMTLVPPELANSQFENSVSVGFDPTIDVAPDDLPEWSDTDTKARCFELMNEAGIVMDSPNAQALAELACNQVWFFEAALIAAGDTINQDTFMEGLDQVSYEPTSGMGLNLSADNRDGLASAANMEFSVECTCFTYTTDPYPLP